METHKHIANLQTIYHKRIAASKYNKYKNISVRFPTLDYRHALSVPGWKFRQTFRIFHCHRLFQSDAIYWQQLIKLNKHMIFYVI